jgi:hypothetical protein
MLDSVNLVVTNVSGQPMGPIFKGLAEAVPAFPMKMEPIGYPETSVTTYQIYAA